MNVIHPWELEDFYRRIRADVLDLEEAFRAGTLEERLPHLDRADLGGPQLANTYARLHGTDPRTHAGLRLDAVRALLEQVRLELFAVQSAGTAELIPHKSRRRPTAFDQLGVVQATLGQHTAVLRLDQFLAARSWGIGFDFEDPHVAEAFALLIARTTAQRLCRDLRSLQKVLRQFEPRDSTDSLRVVPRPPERAFERLMTDILNEETLTAHGARMDQDFLEKTDLYVDYPGLDHPGGARVQVTQTSDLLRHTEKLSAIKQLERMVLLSPRALAAFVEAQMLPDCPRPLLTPQFLRSVWEVLPGKPSHFEELTISIKQRLLAPLRQPPTHPLGPLAEVPRPLRQLIRHFVRDAAFRAVEVIRQNTQTVESITQTVQLPMTPAISVPNRLVKLLWQPCFDGELATLRVGEVVQGTVKSVKIYGVFLNLGEADGLLHVSKLPPSELPMEKRFQVGDVMHVLIMHMDSSNGRVQLALPGQDATADDLAETEKLLHAPLPLPSPDERVTQPMRTPQR